ELHAGIGFVLGNYVYADGAANVAVSAAVDALTVRLQAGCGGVALAFLATPADVFAVPPEAVACSVRPYAAPSRTAKLAGRPLGAVSRGRLASPGLYVRRRSFRRGARGR